MTTHEEIMLPDKKTRKKHPEENYFPYSRGVWKNLRAGFCSPSYKSLVSIQDV